jgi:hypothetical protein
VVDRPGDLRPLPREYAKQMDNERDLDSRRHEAHRIADRAPGNADYAYVQDKTGPYERVNEPISHIVLTGRPGRALYADGRELLVPNQFKLLKLSDNYDFNGDEDGDTPLIPGSFNDFKIKLLSKVAEHKITYDGSSYSINGSRSLDDLDTLEHLILNQHLRENDARLVMENARSKKAYSYLWSKKADDFESNGYPWQLQRAAPGAPTMQDQTPTNDPFTAGMMPAMVPYFVQQQVPGLTARDTDPMVYHPLYGAGSPYDTFPGSSGDQDMAKTVAHAAQTGQKEVLDTAALSAMMKATRNDSMVDRHIGKLIAGMDAQGKILMSCYAHPDRFEERYGHDDAVALQDALRNNFESSGDIILQLKEKPLDTRSDGLSGPSVEEAAE